MTKEECKKLVFDLKEDMDKNFEEKLDAILELGGIELEEADCNYGYARSVFAALLLNNARSYDGFLIMQPSSRNVTVRVSKNAALLTNLY